MQHYNHIKKIFNKCLDRFPFHRLISPCFYHSVFLHFPFSPITSDSQEASFIVWLQFGDDTAILRSAFNEIPLSLHLSALADSADAITPAPSQYVLAQGDGGGPLVKAELLVSTCELVSTHTEMDEI